MTNVLRLDLIGIYVRYHTAKAPLRQRTRAGHTSPWCCPVPSLAKSCIRHHSSRSIKIDSSQYILRAGQKNTHKLCPAS